MLLRVGTVATGSNTFGLRDRMPHRSIWKPIGVCWAVLFLSSCGNDKCRDYSAFTCDEIKAAEYYVWFTFPDGENSYNLGQAKGLDQCGSVARGFAFEKNVQDSNWGYVCCMVAKGSDCYEKHR